MKNCYSLHTLKFTSALALLFLTAFFSPTVTAQTEITNTTGTTTYGGVDVTVTSSGGAGGYSACGANLYSIDNAASQFTYTFSAPVSNVTVSIYFGGSSAQSARFLVNGSTYNVTNSNITGASYDIGFCDLGTVPLTASGGDINNSAGLGSAANGYVSISGTINNFSVINSTASGNEQLLYQIYFTAAPLPLNLLSFTGTSIGKDNQLKWTTTDEVNVAAFTIEKSLNATNFSGIGNVPARNVIGNQQYEYRDVNAHDATAYYRLKMTDKDGTSKYSPIVVIKGLTNNTSSYSIVPNPVIGNTLNITSQSAIQQDIIVNIVDPTGRVLEQGIKTTITGGKATIATMSLPSGLYYLQIIDSKTGATSILKFTK